MQDKNADAQAQDDQPVAFRATVTLTKDQGYSAETMLNGAAHKVRLRPTACGGWLFSSPNYEKLYSNFKEGLDHLLIIGGGMVSYCRKCNSTNVSRSEDYLKSTQEGIPDGVFTTEMADGFYDIQKRQADGEEFDVIERLTCNECGCLSFEAY